MAAEPHVSHTSRDAPGNFQVAGWRVEPATCRISRGDESIKLEPKVMDLLVYLASRRGKVLSREELEATVWPGVVVGYDALTNAIIKLRKALDDDSKHPRIIETISKKGYRLIAAVADVPPQTQTLPGSPGLSIASDVADSSDASSTPEQPPRPSRGPIVVGMLVVLTIAGFIVAMALRSVKPGAPTDTVTLLVPDKPSIAVLPFTNIGADPAKEYFSDGITEDIITDLSRISGLFVIARNSTFRYKDTAVDPRRVAAELGVRYVLSGSVRRERSDIRINVRLVDAVTAQQIWAERYDGKLADVFRLQAEVAGKVRTALAVKLTATEQSLIASKVTENLAAYDAYLKGWRHYLRRRPDDFRQAIAEFEKAIDLDPNYARAHAGLAATYWQTTRRLWHEHVGMPRWHETWAAAEQHLAKAMRDPTSLAYQVAADIHAQARRYDEAIVDAEHAVEIDPNDADGYVELAGVLTLSGRASEAPVLIERAMRLNPHYPAFYRYYVGLARFGLGQFEEAAEPLREAIALNPDDPWPYRLLLAVDGHLGNTDEANQILRKLREPSVTRGYQGYMDPLTIRGTAFWLPFKQPADVARLAEGLRLANVPD